jgi:hypothetical protein
MRKDVKLFNCLVLRVERCEGGGVLGCEVVKLLGWKGVGV